MDGSEFGDPTIIPAVQQADSVLHHARGFGHQVIALDPRCLMIRLFGVRARFDPACVTGDGYHGLTPKNLDAIAPLACWRYGRGKKYNDRMTGPGKRTDIDSSHYYS